MPDFNNKMHQNRNQLGLRPRPHCGSSQRSPRPSSRMGRGIPLPHTPPPRHLRRLDPRNSRSLRLRRSICVQLKIFRILSPELYTVYTAPTNSPLPPIAGPKTAIQIVYCCGRLNNMSFQDTVDRQRCGILSQSSHL